MNCQSGGDALKGDWIANLHTVFINNLSCRVSRKVLWDLFNIYGRVADVYIKYSRNRSYTFAFVRYWLDLESKRAIAEANGRCIDGRRISVNKAMVGWNQCRSYENHKDKTSSGINRKFSGGWKVRDQRPYRSYRDALMKHPSRKMDEPTLEAIRKEDTLTNKVISSESILGGKSEDGFIERFNFNIEIPDSELSWLDNCAIAILKDYVELCSIKKLLLDNGFSGKVSPVGGISICIWFDQANERDKFLEFVSSMDSNPFESITKWDKTVRQRKYYVWILLEEVPLQLWNLKFFESLGNHWGSFIQVDEPTQLKTKLDMARMLVCVDSLAKIPAMINVNTNGYDHRIIISIKEGFWATEEEQSGLQKKNSQLQRWSDADDSLLLVIDRLEPTEFVSALSEVELNGCWGRLEDIALKELSGESSLQLSDKDLCGLIDDSVQWVSYNSRPHVEVVEEHVMEFIDPVLENSKDPKIGMGLGCEIGTRNNNSNLDETDLGKAIIPWEGISIAGYEDHEEIDYEGCLEDGPIGKAMKLRHCRAEGKKVKRKFRKPKRGVNEMIYGDKVMVEMNSDSSISDEEIIHRNKIILKEAEATLEIGSILGFDFLRSNVQMVEIFDNLSKEDCRKE
ncbi:hypothetical protein PTKIN_Ptkin16aG0012900 [Pterospermum kingtungense]